MVTLFNMHGDPLWPTGARQPDKGRGWRRMPDAMPQRQKFEIWMWLDFVRVSSTITKTDKGEWVFYLAISILNKERWIKPPNDISDTVLEAFGLGGALEYRTDVESPRRGFWRPVYNKGPEDG